MHAINRSTGVAMEEEREQILVVDDDDGVRSLVRAVLRRHGHAVDTARDGAEAIQKVDGHRYALILLDLMMPKIDGLEFLERVSEDLDDAGSMVVVMTAGDDTLVSRLDRRRVHGLIR
ncbi:MAG: response regulator, partial [Thermoanaerobaculia bacterium]|nr:response regulator [Thermoanaerobaculia bacterium]